MKVIIKNSELHQKYFYQEQKDRQPRWHTLENDIRLLSAEICRLISLPYSSQDNYKKILYLEELLSAYERDQKKYE